MSVPATIQHTGVLTSLSTGTGTFGAGPIDTSFRATYAACKQGSVDITGATDLAPYVINLENVAKVKALVITATGNSIKMLLTTASGTDQAIRLSGNGPLILHLPTAGDEITAIKFVGTGTTISYIIAGDLT